MTNNTARKIDRLTNDNKLAASIAQAMAKGHSFVAMAHHLSRRTGLNYANALMVVEIHGEAEYSRQDDEAMAEFNALCAAF